MKLNTKVRYGLRAIIEIAIAGKDGLLQKDIAQIQQIPLKYLDTIILGLKTRGLIKNFKGKKSGYILTKPPEEISVYDVYCAFEPELSIVDCLCEPNNCDLKADCMTKGFWRELNIAIKQTLKGKKLDEFIKNNPIE